MKHPDTVRVASEPSEENPHGYIVINHDDYDPAVHELWTEAVAAEFRAKRKTKGEG